MDKLKFEMTLEQVNVVLTGLSKLPIEQGFDVYMYVRSAAEAQLQSQAPAEPSDVAGE